MPQIAYLLSPKGAMNQQKEKPVVENSPIVSYAQSLKSNTFSFSPVEKKIKQGPSFFNRLLGSLGFGENKATAKLYEILNVLQKSDERKERDYQIMRMNEEMKNEKDQLRHNEIVNLFVQATKKRKKQLTKVKTKPMGGGIASTLLVAGGVIGLLAFSSDAVASINKNVKDDLVKSVKDEFEKELDGIKTEFTDMFSIENFKKQYEEIRNFFLYDLLKLSSKAEDVTGAKPEDFFKEGSEEFPSKVEQIPVKPETIPKTATPMDEMRDVSAKFESHAKQIENELRAKEEPLKATQVSEIPPTETARPVSRRAAELSIRGETGAETREVAFKKLGQIVQNDPKPGEKSYGIFGMNTFKTPKQKASAIEQFSKMFPEFGLEGLKPGSDEFDKKWEALATTDAERFFNAQIKWHTENILKPLEQGLSKLLPSNIANDPRVLVYMADRRLQYGYVLENEAFLSAKDAKTPEEFIRLMSIFDRQNVEKAFQTTLAEQKNKQRFIEGLLDRINRRESESLTPVNRNILGNLIDNGSIQLSSLLESQYDAVPLPAIAINNTNFVSQTRKSIKYDTSSHAHHLVT